MFFQLTTLITALIIGIVVFAAKEELHPGNGPAGHQCEATRRTLAENFLHAEKSRLFADVTIESLRQIRWLPLHFDETGGTIAQFFLLEGNFTAAQAWRACQKMDNAQLASLHTPRRLEHVNKILVSGGYWFGLHRWPRCPYFIWSNGQFLGNSTSYWINSDEPRPHGTPFECVRAVSPSDMVCDGPKCTASNYATWITDYCDSTELAGTYSALCETPYPRPMYSLISGKFDRDSADAACKDTFSGLMKPGLAKVKYLSDFNMLFGLTRRHYKNWNCWVGMERFPCNIGGWRHRWIDNSIATRFTHMAMLHNRNFSYWTDEKTCISLYDPDYAASLSYASEGFYDYNDCTTKLDCAICEWYWPL